MLYIYASSNKVKISNFMLDISTLGHSFAFEAHTISILLSARDEHYHNPTKDAD